MALDTLEFRCHMRTLIDAYGVSRTRDKKGVIVKQTTLPWVNCIHTNVGGGWKTMEVLILEVYDKDSGVQYKETAE